jgi:hypothetical protein
MSENTTLETLATEVKQRLDALGEQVPDDAAIEAKVKDMVQAYLGSEDGEDLVRKMKFGQESDPKLVGTKYSRLGMSVADVEWLYDLQDSLKGQRKVGGGTHEGPSEDLRNTYSAVTDATRVPSLVARADDERVVEEQYRRGVLNRQGYQQAMDAIGNVYGAMDTAETGYGAEIIGTQYVRELWAGARRQSRVFGLIEQFEMTDPTAYLPVEADIPEMLFVGESTANNSANYSTVKTGSNRVQVAAKKFVIHQMWSGEMEEDSIIPYVPFLRRQQAVSLAHYSDSLVLNGDTTNAGTGNINLDDADPADTKHYLAFDGVRHAGLVDNTANRADLAGAVSLNAFKASRGRMIDRTYLHDWGHPVSPEDLVYVADPESADATAFLDEVLTVDKYGPQATVLTGEQGRVLGHPLISSIAMSKTEADGKVSTTGGNNTKGQIVGFNRRGYVVGVRRRLKVETERLPGSDQTRIVLSTRLGFGRFAPTGAASGIESADVLYNISL